MKMKIIFLLTLLSASLQAQVIHARFNDGSGTTAVNSGSAGAAANGTLTGAPAWSTAAKIWGGLVLNGTSQYANFGSTSAIDNLPSSDATFEAWVLPTTCNTTRYLGGKTSGGADGFYLYISSSNCDPRIDVNMSGRTATYQAATGSLRAGVWAHLGFVWTAATKTAKIYINGREAAYSVQTSGSGTYLSDAAQSLILGIPNAGGLWGINAPEPLGYAYAYGTVDDFRVWSSARTARQVALDMGYAPTSAAPVVLLKNSATQWAMRVQILGINGATVEEGDYIEYVLNKLTSNGNVWAIQGQNIVDAIGAHPSYSLQDTTSVLEFAYQIGITADAVELYNYQGGGHGFTSLTSFAITMDGADASALAVDSPVRGSAVVVTQAMNGTLPKDGTTATGTIALSHTFNSAGMLVDHTHTSNAGFSYMNSYAAMLPVTGARGGISYAQIGNNSVRGPFSYDSTVYDNTSPSQTSAIIYGTIPYQLKLTLPDGGPDTSGSWANDVGEKFWLHDTTQAKLYVNLVSGGYATRIVLPTTTRSRAQYAAQKTL